MKCCPAGAESVLDDDFCPVKWLIQPKHEDNNGKKVLSTVQFLKSDAKTIGLVTHTDQGAVLQAYSREGGLLNEAVLGRFASSWATNAQLLSMGNGYLFSDRQLVWIHAETQKRSAWRFGPPCNRTATDKWGDRWRYFGDPLLVDACLYVTDIEGRLYIFDVARILELASASAAPNSAEAEVDHWK